MESAERKKLWVKWWSVHDHHQRLKETTVPMLKGWIKDLTPGYRLEGIQRLHVTVETMLLTVCAKLWVSHNIFMSMGSLTEIQEHLLAAEKLCEAVRIVVASHGVSACFGQGESSETKERMRPLMQYKGEEEMRRLVFQPTNDDAEGSAEAVRPPPDTAADSDMLTAVEDVVTEEEPLVGRAEPEKEAPCSVETGVEDRRDAGEKSEDEGYDPGTEVAPGDGGPDAVSPLAGTVADGRADRRDELPAAESADERADQEAQLDVVVAPICGYSDTSAPPGAVPDTVGNVGPGEPVEGDVVVKRRASSSRRDRRLPRSQKGSGMKEGDYAKRRRLKKPKTSDKPGK